MQINETIPPPERPRPPLDIEDPALMETGQAPARNEVIDFVRTREVYQKIKAQTQEKLARVHDAYHETASESPVTAFLQDVLASGEVPLELAQIERGQSPVLVFQKHLESFLTRGAFPAHIVERHLDALAPRSAVDQVIVLLEHYPRAAFFVLKKMPIEKQGDSRRFSVAELIISREPSLIRQFGSIGFSDTDIEAMIFRTSGRDPKKAFLMRDHLNVPYNKAEAFGLLEDVYQKIHGASEWDRDGLYRQAGDIIRLASFSKEEVQGFLGRQGLDTIKELHRLFRVPPIEKTVHWVDAAGFLRGRENVEGIDERREDALDRFAEKTEMIEGAVFFAMKDAYPHQTERLQAAYDRTRALQTAAVERVGTLDQKSATAPLRLKMEGFDVPIVYKTPQREPVSNKELYTEFEQRAYEQKGIDLNQPVREGIAPGEAFKREWLCKVIDTVFQFNLVPPTVIRRGPEGVGSCQAWEIGAPALTISWKERLPSERCMELAVFDYLVQHCDRHGGNFLITPENDVVAIDNGFSFSTARDEVGGYGHKLRSLPSFEVAGAMVPTHIQDKLRQGMAQPKLVKVLKAAFEHVFGAEAQRMFAAFSGRVQDMAPNPSSSPAIIRSPVWI